MKKALGEKIIICENCLKEGRQSVFQGWNSSQHVKAKKNIGCTTDRNFFKDSFYFCFFETYELNLENFSDIEILKIFCGYLKSQSKDS